MRRLRQFSGPPVFRFVFCLGVILVVTLDFPPDLLSCKCMTFLKVVRRPGSKGILNIQVLFVAKCSRPRLTIGTVVVSGSSLQAWSSFCLLKIATISIMMSSHRHRHRRRRRHHHHHHDHVTPGHIPGVYPSCFHMFDTVVLRWRAARGVAHGLCMRHASLMSCNRTFQATASSQNLRTSGHCDKNASHLS